MSYCTECGRELVLKNLENEGMVPYCERCGQFRFPMFNTAISAIVYAPDGKHIILIQQYGRKQNILVAGYVSRGESTEETLVREIREELGLEVTDYTFNASSFFERSNTLMVNFACRVSSDSLEGVNHEEVDLARWYTPEEAKENILENSLAKRFLLKWLDKQTFYPSGEEMKRKTILCYGDSNTYGYSPEDGSRYPRGSRWPGILQGLLGEDCTVVEEGCNGRTTVIVDEQEPWKCGETSLKACLNTHKPVDLLIIMLGTNDMKKQYYADAAGIAAGAEKLARISKEFLQIKQDYPPEILLVAPPELRAGISRSPFKDSFSEDAVKVSGQLAPLYEQAAQRTGCHFLNAAEIVESSREDHLHLTSPEHGKLAAAIARKVQEIFGGAEKEKR